MYTRITASLPFIEVDLKLSRQQMNMLINGLKYIIPCQSQFSRRSLDERATEQYQNIVSVVKNCLDDHRIPSTDQRAKQTFEELQSILYNLLSRPIPRKLRQRSQYEYKIVQSIRRLLKRRPDVVIRRTDKSKVFYIGKAIDFERKAEEYMLKTEAYQEMTSGRCPLSDILHAVHTLLAYVVKRQALTAKQRSYISPKLNTLELGHYYGLPKPHKVSTF